MVLIIGCALFVSIFPLFYLQQKFRFSTLAHEIQQMRTEKKKLLIGIDKVRIEAAQYSSMHRVDELFSTLIPPCDRSRHLDKLGTTPVTSSPHAQPPCFAGTGDELRRVSPSSTKQNITTLKVPVLSGPVLNRPKGDLLEEREQELSEGAQGIKSPSQSEPFTENIIIRQHE